MKLLAIGILSAFCVTPYADTLVESIIDPQTHTDITVYTATNTTSSTQTLVASGGWTINFRITGSEVSTGWSSKFNPLTWAHDDLPWSVNTTLAPGLTLTRQVRIFTETGHEIWTVGSTNQRRDRYWQTGSVITDPGN
jgi:hypothetical protein